MPTLPQKKSKQGKRTYDLITKGTEVTATEIIMIVGAPRRFIQENWEGVVVENSTSAYVKIAWSDLSGAEHSVHRDRVKITQ